MTSWWQLFKVFCKQKSKSVYLIFIFQLISSFALIIMAKPVNSNNFYSDAGLVKISNFSSFCLGLVVIIFMTTFLAEGVLGILTTIKNERFNKSKTWRLIPISSGRYFTANIASSVLELIWLGMLNLVTIMVLGVIALPGMQPNKWLGKMLNDIGKGMSTSEFIQMFSYLISIVIFLLLIAIAWYLMISFLNYSSSAIVNFLPKASNKLVLFIVRAITIIILLVLFDFVSIYFGNIFQNIVNWILAGSEAQTGDMLKANLAIFIFDIIVAGVDIGLFNKFFEAKIEH
ncbi:hypothetical protein [Lactobacillus intestinalis]|uniref:hypothetical protein n=1 Tax=Lactobacillus intestinalis TaxID=151781 RepID=UPI00202CFF7E|nr:hypothetical protein [Lactobacillus intestinalis]KAI4309812.1 hypothetical protein C821_001538 [Lactobacillus intestinalis]